MTKSRTIYFDDDVFEFIEKQTSQRSRFINDIVREQIGKTVIISDESPTGDMQDTSNIPDEPMTIDELISIAVNDIGLSPREIRLQGGFTSTQESAIMERLREKSILISESRLHELLGGLI